MIQSNQLTLTNEWTQFYHKIYLAFLETSIEDWTILIHNYTDNCSRKTTVISTEQWLSKLNQYYPSYSDSYLTSEIDSDGVIRFYIQYFNDPNIGLESIRYPLKTLGTSIPLVRFYLTYEMLNKIPITKELIYSKANSKFKEMIAENEFHLTDYGLELIDSTIDLNKELKVNEWKRESSIKIQYINKLISEPVVETEFTKLLRKTYKEVLGDEVVKNYSFSSDSLRVKRNKTYKIISAILDSEK